MTDGFDEKSLVKKAQDGDKGAFEELMRRYEKKIYCFVLSYVKNPHDAEDVTQDTFLRAYRFINSFAFRSSVSTWLHTIAKNMSMTFIKKKSTYSCVSAETEEMDLYETSVVCAASGQKTPEDQVIGDELMIYIKNAIESLPDEFREVIVMREINSLSYTEIAEITESELGTVKSRISRGRAMLREFLSEYTGKNK
ncbi:ECF RNA polymerase sigma factor SigW [bioreactor metagenome]|uniref:ECF RNA polymerase sigma factor SigW n=1 Tax=bioreactor metagenome TaxID=1076179 RepID=A0A644YMG5_9ZZZZ|nr:sigma-70 family RNA polymerase sigma factor [Oscillospiraceae bacterium]